MITGFDFNIRKIILSLLLVSGVTFSLISQEAHIGGVVNDYQQVVSIGVNDNVTLNNADIFEPGDTVLLIQMKGVVMYGYEDNQNGYWAYNLGTPGGYEFLIIRSVDYNTEIVQFTRYIVNNYDVAGLVQLIKVPSYSSATVTSELSCQPWDSATTKTGGVLALIVGGTLTLDASINVAGKGFAGGIPFTGDGICIINNLPLYDKYAYPSGYTNSGYKGEGLVSRAYLAPGNVPPVYPNYAKGKGFNFNGGGGGNGRFSGGGGGAGIGFGGKGGRESYALCSTDFGDGGLRGQQVDNTVLDGNILLGGGGGSSTAESGSSATPGGRGGGIIIIVCDTLRSNGINAIVANGENAVPATGNAGAGGGGGGGSIALFQQIFSLQTASSELKISANGGNGGNSSNNNGGEGGGGGGGLVFTTVSTFPEKITVSYAGGVKGTRGAGSTTANNGLPGESLPNFTPLLNGFLFNIVRSSANNNQYDSVCSNTRPPKILGTKPVGGSGSYSYIWQKSYESTFASPIVLVNDANPLNYTPTLADAITPTDTVWFRRVVIDAGSPPITDISRPVKILVHPAITNNIVGNQDTICYNGNPPLIQQLLPDLIVPSTNYLFYAWQDSSSAGTWGENIGSEKEFDPAAGLVGTTKYRRIVTSGSCIDTSRAVEMTVLPIITGNTIKIRPPAEDSVCYGTQFQELISAGTLGGGDNLYRFKWESSYNYSPWETAQGTFDRDSILPVILPTERIPENYYRFRRIVYSGHNDVCSDISDTIDLRDFPHITNNLISTIPENPFACYGSLPVKINGNQPNNGSGKFTWQDSTSSSGQWEDIAGFVNTGSAEFQPPVMTETTSYRRIAFSYGCSDTSNAIKITVLSRIENNTISLSSSASDTTICNGQAPRIFIGTDPAGGAGGPYSYHWLHSTDLKNFSEIPGAVQVNFPDPPSLNVTTYYKRQVIDRQSVCIDTSSSMITINVLLPVSNNFIASDQTAICENTTPDPLNGSAPAGGSGSYLFFWEQSLDGGGSWTDAEGSNSLKDYQPPALTKTIKYRRRILSGLADCCSDTSLELEIIVNPEPDSPVNAGADESIYSLDKTHIMKADPPVITGEYGFWTALDPTSSIIDNVNDSKTMVRNLSRGKNIFVWTISKGPCSLDDSVSVELLPDFIPQGFSPNGDAWNNNFIIEGLNLTDKQVADLSILNGAGTVVFSTSNRDGQEWVDWDGRNNKGAELPEGTYYYLLKLTTQDNKVIKKSGFIELKRY
jgi:gliding motility-associated-like protein